jgi:hypothetical protein
LNIIFREEKKDRRRNKEVRSQKIEAAHPFKLRKAVTVHEKWVAQPKRSAGWVSEANKKPQKKREHFLSRGDCAVASCRDLRRAQSSRFARPSPAAPDFAALRRAGRSGLGHP